MTTFISEIFSVQPYYNTWINQFRGGMFMMILGTTIVDLFAYLFGKGKSFFSILLIIIGIIFFAGGFVLCRIKGRKSAEEIYRKFKAKKLEDKMVYNHIHGISDTESEESGSISSDNSDSESEKEQVKEEKLISVDSYNSEEEDNDDDDKDNHSIVISDKISERITSFGNMNEISNIIN
ncbi:hypothetical protein PIROE2DRAFT_63370 [Piromyces sp. E2]|nr:hypothetical protein PIROE2DRAFT_63370 [Piromyces sp. E2]|eukprot:OUM60062.1 hypothetical protein PIROE2DRAFT_63370 [Piromyces sp. E2]